MFTQFTNYVAKSVGTAVSNIVTIPANQQFAITQLCLANTTFTPVTCSAYVTRAGVDCFIVRNATLPQGGSLVLAGDDQKIVMMTGDVLRVTASTASSVDVVCSGVLNDLGGNATVPAPVTPPVQILATPFVSGGLMTYDFQGANGATSTTQTSGSLSTTMVLTNSSISNVRGPAVGATSLFVNGSAGTTTARAEVTGLTISPTNFTWEGWIYYPSFSTAASSVPIFSLGNDSQNLIVPRWLSTTLVEFRTNISNTSQPQGGNVNMSATPASGVWQHHAITADGTNYRYYLDGTLIGQTTNNLGTWGYLGTAGRQINTYTIGNWLGAPFSTWSNAYFWNCRLSPSVVYTANFTVNKTGMF